MTAIMVVEDSSDLARAIQRDLEKEGYQVTIAADGKEALVLFEQLSPDLIILDWMLLEPDISRDGNPGPLWVVIGRHPAAYRH